MKDVVRVKPHHLIDILTTFGGGGGESFRPHPYGHAVHLVAEQVLADPELTLEMELGADDICAPCLHNIDGLCDDTIDTTGRPEVPPAKRQWNLMLDRRWCDRLGLAQGDRLTARQFARRALERAGDITDIYREMPPDGTAERARKLRAGLERFLAPRR